MDRFEFYAPTKVYFGKKQETKVGEILEKSCYKKVLVHYGGNSAKKSGLLDIVCNSLKEHNVDYVTLGGVVSNPVLSKVREGISICKEENIDFILAVGGGSVLDSAKAIGYGVMNEGDVWDYYLGKKEPKACLPVGVVLTIAATGSEMSNSSVITNEEGGYKRALNHELVICKFAILNPELTYTLPNYQTESGCTDILMHTMERYFNKVKTLELNDQFAESLMRVVIMNAKILKDHPNDYDARAEVMWAASLSHNDITGSRTYGDWACHQLEHELGGMFQVAHGAGLAAIWASWARYVYQEKPERFARYARNVWDIREADDIKAALAGIDATEKFFKEIDMPINLHELLNRDITDKEIKELSYKCSFEENRTIGKFKVLTIEDMEKIYMMAK